MSINVMYNQRNINESLDFNNKFGVRSKIFLFSFYIINYESINLFK